MISVGQERECESVLGRKPRLARFVQDAHPEHRRFTGFELRKIVLKRARFLGASGGVVFRVVSEQFAWNEHYPGSDGKFGRRDIKLVAAENPLGLDKTDPDAKDDITTINQLNLPVDRPILVHLSSKDVIHSFGLIEMRVKQDAIPGMDIPVWFIPNKVGEFEIACSQLCGLGHYRMRGFVSVKSQADYDAWLATEAKNLTAR